jgi:uncharacterized protein YjiS (DUF1127 family)
MMPNPSRCDTTPAPALSVAIFESALSYIASVARRMRVHARQRQQARATRDALRTLDDHTLRDLGFDRSEIASVGAEIAGRADRTRVRTRQTAKPSF